MVTLDYHIQSDTMEELIAILTRFDLGVKHVGGSVEACGGEATASITFEPQNLAKNQGENTVETPAAENDKAPEESPSEAPKTAEKVGVTEARAVLLKLKNEKGAKALKELLKHYGAEVFSDVAQDSYSALMKDAEDMLNAAG